MPTCPLLRGAFIVPKYLSVPLIDSLNLPAASRWIVRKWCTAIEIILGIVFLCALDLPYRHDILLGHNDFSTFYAGAKLARTPALYNHEIVRHTVRAGWPDSPEQEVYLRAPFYAELLSPLAALPYRTALLIFTGLTVGSFLWFVIRFSRECPDLAILAAFSIPMFFNINGGADVPLLLPLLGAFVLLSRRGRDFAAGFVLAFCAIKFHLFVFVPFLLLFKKKWRMLLGASAGTALLALVGGVSLIGPWLKVIFSPLITGMPVWKLCPTPNIHGLVTVLGGEPRNRVLTRRAGHRVLRLGLPPRRQLRIASRHKYYLRPAGELSQFHLRRSFADAGAGVGRHRSGYFGTIIGLALTPVVFLATFAGGLYSAILPLMLLAFLSAVWFLQVGQALSPANRLLHGLYSLNFGWRKSVSNSSAVRPG